MPPSPVNICNIALSHLGAGGIDALTERSAEANACQLHYDIARDATLRDFPWNFATKRAVLAALSETPPAPWSYLYALPTDCLLAREIVNSGGTARIPFSVESNSGGTARVLLSDQSSATLVYTARVTEAALFDPMFVEALSWRLAALICMPITRNRNIMQMAQTMYLNAIAQAQRADGNEGQADTPADADWIVARGIGGGDTRYPWRP